MIIEALVILFLIFQIHATFVLFALESEHSAVGAIIVIASHNNYEMSDSDLKKVERYNSMMNFKRIIRILFDLTLWTPSQIFPELEG